MKKEKQKKSIYLVFDLDGILVPAGIGLLDKNKTLEKYFIKNKRLIKTFRKKLLSFRRNGFGLAINTGRGISFAKKIEKKMFPLRRVDFMECEIGAINFTKSVVNKEIKTVKEISETINKDSLIILNKNKKQIYEYVKNVLGGRIEKKEIMITIIPKKIKEINKDYKKIQEFLKKLEIFKKVNIVFSGIAIDIIPKGVDKLRGLRKVTEENDIIYFGDSFSDEIVMKKAIISIAPSNANKSTKKKVKKSSLGILPEKAELAGVIEALTKIENLYKKT